MQENNQATPLDFDDIFEQMSKKQEQKAKVLLSDNNKHFSKEEKQLLKNAYCGKQFVVQSGQKLQSWQKRHNLKVARQDKKMDRLVNKAGGDMSKVWKIQTQRKRLPFLILFVILLVGIFGLAIAGVVLAAIDFKHQIFNAKSICFMTFGCLVVLIYIVPIIASIISSIHDNKKQKQIEKAQDLLKKLKSDQKTVTLDDVEKAAKLSGISSKIMTDVYLYLKDKEII